MFFIDVPELDFHPASCVDSRPVRISHDPLRARCGVPVSVVAARQSAYREIVNHLKSLHPRLRVFDPLPYLCDDSYCSAIHDNRFVYRDSNHLSVYGSQLLSVRLVEWLRTTS